MALPASEGRQARYSRGHRQSRLLLLTVAAWLFYLARPASFVGGTPAQHPVSQRSAVVDKGGRTDEDRLEFMNSPVGQVVGAVASALSTGPLNEGKIWLAKTMAGDYDEAAVSAKLESYISENPAVVFSFSTCPFCIKAKRELDDLGVKYLAVELDQMGDEGKQIRAELAKKTQRTSMPNIFIGGEGVGGCNDGPGIMTLKSKGELVPMLESAGAMDERQAQEPRI
eukprot:CAMPEP_0170645250 /NCGR_PEP_ID=MMETSP0224-20130122/42967_1 /TAXON_ID=285029 /ORGANISM="Togula jolla, Strain CCCM 725" /LENGTH=225 /DNA_ID=CAMNT_0010976429 /DNA_START=57 /DNA_END=735 /DNA_ORIENTATION=+